MNDRYFDDWETRRIYPLTTTNPFLAKKKYEQYLVKYPKDYGTHVKYASLLTTLGYFEESLEVLDFVESIYKNDNKINKNSEKIDYIEGLIAMEKIRTLTYLNEYEAAYDLYATKFDLISDKVSKVVYTYLRKQLGFPKPLINEESSYMYKQIFNYSEEELLEKLKVHLQEYCMDFDEPKGSVFFSYFPVERVLEEVKKYIPSEKKMNPGFYNDTYIFKYDRNGVSGNIPCNYFTVRCFAGTNQIITMYPCDRIKGIDYVDLNYLDFEKVDDKRRNRVERFNKKLVKKKTYN